jgi:hypothetical protein
MSKKSKIPNPKVPRTLEELTREYQELSAQAANSQYTAYVHNKELERINTRLVEINTEAAERKQLDAANAADAAKAAATEQTKSGAV